MFDPWVVVTIVVVVLTVTGGVKVSIGDINIGNRSKQKNDTK